MMTGTAFSSASASWPRAFIDLLHHAALVLELIDSVLKLLIEHHAVSDDDYAIENALARGIVQRGQTVRQPANGVALSAAGGVLDKVVVPDALTPGGIHQHADRLELMVAGEDHGIDLHLAALIVPLLLRSASG